MAASEFERIVREAMEREGLSLSRLAAESRIERTRWYVWFRGENRPTARSLSRAAKVLGVELDQLLAPWGSTAGSGSIVDSDLAALTAAVNRLADVLSGRLEDLAPEIAEGTAQGRRQAGGAPPKPAPLPQ